MARLQIISLAILTLLASACGRSDSIEFDNTPTSVMGDGIYQYGATIDGEIIWWTVHFDDVARTPDWSPGTEPPLSLSRAVDLASKELPKYTDIPAAYPLDKVELMNVTNGGPSKKWLYLVSFERVRQFQGREFRARGTVTIPVLLNGMVVEGRRGNRPPS